MLQRPRRRCEGTAMGAIVLDLRPGLGIGPFSIGDLLLIYVFAFLIIEYVHNCSVFGLGLREFFVELKFESN